MIGPTCVVVPAGDFASAFADLEALEPVARVPSLGLDPRREFFLSCRRRQGRIAQKQARAVSARLLRRLQGLDLAAQIVFVDFQRTHQAPGG
jgi:hypothetical protein